MAFKNIRASDASLNILSSSKEATFVNSNDIRCKQVDY